ncbi:MAG: diguanylate cyclase [Magnetococcus sp. WYHC-3]
MSLERTGRVLVVDDEPDNIEVLAEVLGDLFEVLFATNGEQALALASSTHPDLILLDVVMPGLDGFAVCARLRQDRATAGIPVIFVTSMGDSATEAHGLEIGAVDFISKPVNPPVVRARVRNHIELKQARDRLTLLASTDGLTGLVNRRSFDDSLTMEYHRLARNQRELSLILFDVDHFKLFNDTYGHQAGDDCLRRVGQTVLGVLNRSADITARYGGEEFACILPETDSPGAVAVAERLRQAVESLAIPHLRSPTVPRVTISLGVATVFCHGGQSPLQVVALADEQLYRAKHGGRNRVAWMEWLTSPP